MGVHAPTPGVRGVSEEMALQLWCVGMRDRTKQDPGSAWGHPRHGRHCPGRICTELTGARGWVTEWPEDSGKHRVVERLFQLWLGEGLEGQG